MTAYAKVAIASRSFSLVYRTLISKRSNRFGRYDARHAAALRLCN
jgi:hypothetical protein